MQSAYEFAGRDLALFVADWLVEVKREDAPSRGLLEFVAEDYLYGGAFLMANIAPRATAPDADHETLLLYAVLSAYQEAGFPEASGWQGEEAHVERAFDHARAHGIDGVARALLTRVAERSRRPRPPELEWMIANSLGHDPGRGAAHDREMASIQDRDVRAARLVDPSLHLDDFILGDATGPAGES